MFKVKRIHGRARTCGHWDSAGRWYPKDEYLIPGTFEVRTPTRRWWNSYLRHFESLRYATRLYAYNPALYCQAQGWTGENNPVEYLDAMQIRPGSDEEQRILRSCMLRSITGGRRS